MWLWGGKERRGSVGGTAGEASERGGRRIETVRATMDARVPLGFGVCAWAWTWTVWTRTRTWTWLAAHQRLKVGPSKGVRASLDHTITYRVAADAMAHLAAPAAAASSSNLLAPHHAGLMLRRPGPPIPQASVASSRLVGADRRSCPAGVTCTVRLQPLSWSSMAEVAEGHGNEWRRVSGRLLCRSSRARAPSNLQKQLRAVRRTPSTMIR